MFLTVFCSVVGSTLPSSPPLPRSMPASVLKPITRAKPGGLNSTPLLSACTVHRTWLKPVKWRNTSALFTMKSIIPFRKGSMPCVMSSTLSKHTTLPLCVPPHRCTCWHVSSSLWASRWCLVVKVPMRFSGVISTSTKPPHRRLSTKKRSVSSPNCTYTTVCVPIRALLPGGWKVVFPSSIKSFWMWQ